MFILGISFFFNLLKNIIELIYDYFFFGFKIYFSYNSKWEKITIIYNIFI